ncbi:MAG: isochorismatase family cysteine hydrolase [Terriglobia bacterium]
MSVTLEPLVFFDVDTQVDFMRPEGRLYVPGAEEIVPNLERLMNWARENGAPVISTADAHSPDDPEFKTWPPHCVIGTPGQRLIPETRFSAPVVIPSRPGAFQPPARWVGQFIVEKPTYSPEDNPNFDDLLRALGPRHAVVFGVATEFCVRAAALALCRHGFQVDVVADAIKAITVEGSRKALEEMAAAGVRRVTTAEICRPVARPTAPRRVTAPKL